jgi:hypothetical protein
MINFDECTDFFPTAHREPQRYYDTSFLLWKEKERKKDTLKKGAAEH